MNVVKEGRAKKSDSGCKVDSLATYCRYREKNTIIQYAVQCNAIQWNAIQYNAVQYNAV